MKFTGIFNFKTIGEGGGGAFLGVIAPLPEPPLSQFHILMYLHFPFSCNLLFSVVSAVSVVLFRSFRWFRPFRFSGFVSTFRLLHT